MLTFKQFLMEGVVDQVQSTRTLVKQLTPQLETSTKGSGGGFLYSSPNLELSNTKKANSFVDTAVMVRDPHNGALLGQYSYQPVPSPQFNSGKNVHTIKVFTTTPEQIGIEGSKENSTLRHEFQHRAQAQRVEQDNPGMHPEEIMIKMRNLKYHNIQPANPANHLGMFLMRVGPKLSYELSAAEANARGIQRAGDAIIDQNKLSRMVVVNQPKVRDFEYNFEKSGGKLKAPELPPDIGRWAADAAFRINAKEESKRLDDINKDVKDGVFRKSDATNLTKDIVKTRKSVNLDIAKGVHANVPNAQSIAQDAFDERVTGVQRERATRVANTRAEVEGSKAKYGGFQVSPFLSDPLSTANMAADMAGALGDVHSRAQTMTKAAASLNNPNFSDSEQMMGDAFLRGNGEEYVVDPRFLQVANQRAKDRLRDEEWNKRFFHNSFERR